MTRTGKIALAAAGLTLVLGGAAAVAHKHSHWGHGHHGRMGFGGPFGAVCAGNASEMADHMLVRLEHRLKLADTQKPAFDELKQTMKSAAAKVAAACPPKPEPAADGTKLKRSPVERLGDAEASLTATLDAVRMIRPVAVKLYTSLSDEQKKIVDDMGPRGKHGRSDWHDRRDRDEPRGGPDNE